MIFSAHRRMYDEMAQYHKAAQYTVWVGYPVILILFSTYFVQLVAPNAIGMSCICQED